MFKLLYLLRLGNMAKKIKLFLISSASSKYKRPKVRDGGFAICDNEEDLEIKIILSFHQSK